MLASLNPPHKAPPDSVYDTRQDVAQIREPAPLPPVTLPDPTICCHPRPQAYTKSMDEPCRVTPPRIKPSSPASKILPLSRGADNGSHRDKKGSQSCGTGFSPTWASGQYGTAPRAVILVKYHMQNHYCCSYLDPKSM